MLINYIIKIISDNFYYSILIGLDCFLKIAGLPHENLTNKADSKIIQLSTYWDKLY